METFYRIALNKTEGLGKSAIKQLLSVAGRMFEEMLNEEMEDCAKQSSQP